MSIHADPDNFRGGGGVQLRFESFPQKKGEETEEGM